MFSVVQINPDRPIISGDQKVIKSQDYLAYREAKELIILAQSQAKTILGEAQEAKQALYEDTKQKAIEAANREFELIKFEQACKTLSYLSDLEKSIVDVVDETLRSVIAEHSCEVIIQNTIQKAFKKLYADRRVTIVTSSDSHHLVKSELDNLQSQYPDKEGIETKVDPSLTDTNLRFETPTGVIRFNLNTELEVAMQKLQELLL